MNAYYKETEKPFGYLLVDNKPDTPADKQVLGDLFGDCRVYLFATQTKVNSTSVEPTPSHKPGRKQPKHRGILPGRMQLFPSCKTTLWEHRWSTFPKDTEMYKSSRNSFDPSHPGVYIGGENYWPVKIMNQSTAV
jgi:hypothetical protein